MVRISTFAALALALVLVACAEDPSGPGSDGAELDLGSDGTCSCSATVPTAPTPSAELASGRVEYDAGECPIAGRAPGVAVPEGAIVQALECDGPTCYDAADLLFVDGGDAYLVACLDAERYEIRWLAIR